jgi:hypothetical protein
MNVVPECTREFVLLPFRPGISIPIRVQIPNQGRDGLVDSFRSPTGQFVLILVQKQIGA